MRTVHIGDRRGAACGRILDNDSVSDYDALMQNCAKFVVNQTGRFRSKQLCTL
jgi:hypothetical protein